MEMLRRLRSLGAGLWLALALALGQQAFLLHQLEHAVAALASGQSLPAPAECPDCAAGSTLATGIGASVPGLAEVHADGPPDAIREPRIAPAAPRFAFHSRAPPALPA